MKQANNQSPKRPYQKPRLRTIKLAADEVLAKGCKMATPSMGRQNTGCAAGGCFGNGS